MLGAVLGVVAFGVWRCFKSSLMKCRNLTLAKWGWNPKVGDLESSGTPKNSELDCRGLNTSHWGVLDIIGKVSKCRCPKWPRMSHLDICSPSYGQKKGRESDWQFDSRPLKVRNQLDFDVRWGSAKWRWKALEKSYNIGLEPVPIGGCGKKLWWSKVLGVQTGTVSGLHFGSPGTKNHLGVGVVEQRREYYMGKVVASPESGPWWVKWVQGRPCLVPTPKWCRMSSNQLVVGSGCMTE
jgi:hypothetical protein